MTCNFRGGTLVVRVNEALVGGSFLRLLGAGLSSILSSIVSLCIACEMVNRIVYFNSGLPNCKFYGI